MQQENYEILYNIIQEVWNNLGSGFREEIYEEAIKTELRLKNINFESQRMIGIKYKDHFIGYGVMDILVYFKDEIIILELKAISKLREADKNQLKNYLKLYNTLEGLLINFSNQYKLEIENISFL